MIFICVDRKLKFSFMNYTKLSSIALAITALSFTACDNAPKGDEAKVSEKQEAAQGGGETFSVDTTGSYVRFTGNGVGKNHPGRFKISSGNLAVAGDKISGGQFTIDR